LFGLDDGVLSLEVTDRGAAFDPLQAAAPDTSAGLDDRRPGGLGIMLVRTLMDAVRYERRGAHNHLTMIWRLRPDDDPAPAEKETTNDD
jgi:anti-sigma regulatory factor (Ser/Thr protein kinase)